jgi:hypothetical protein
MKKKVLVVFLFLLVFSLIFISAASNDTQSRAYSCLEEKTEDKCSSLSTEEKIFTVLAIGDCKSELLDDSDYMSDTKLTAQAILALERSGSNIDDAKEWLISQNTTPTNVNWLLQIESNNQTSCEVTFGTSTPVTITVNDDKTLSGGGTCLNLYNDYWFEVPRTCFSQEIQISCSKAFSTNLLYKKSTSDIIYVSEDTHSASAGGITTEQISSFCFATSSSCDYEGSLWASIVLDYLGYDVSPYLPYLITMMDEAENKKYLPESFLYSLTGNFRSDLLLKQLSEGSWKVSDDKFYDTALALLPFQGETITEKTNTINWLTEIQGTDGCWNSGNTRDTAFLLYSIWPKSISGTSDDENDCEDSGYHCMSQMTCSDIEGEVLTSYGGCFGTSICCSKEKALESCSAQGGEICASGEECSVSTVEASDTSVCCLGDCKEVGEVETPECELQGGSCKSYCSDEEKQISYSCPSPDICCTAKKTSGVLIIVILTILIIFTVIGIIFRKKLRELFFRFKSKFQGGKGKPSTGRPPTTPPSMSVYPGAIPRRVIPNQRTPIRATPARKTEFDDVLKRLKEIGK